MAVAGKNIERRRRNRWRPRYIQPCCTQNLLQLARSDHGIDFRNVFLNLVAIAFHQTTGHDEPARRAGRLQLRHFQNRVHRFLLRLINKCAGIHHQDVSCFRVSRQLRPGAIQQPHHDFTVDQILRASQRDKPHSGPHRLRRRRLFHQQFFNHTSILPGVHRPSSRLHNRASAITCSQLERSSGNKP